MAATSLGVFCVASCGSDPAPSSSHFDGGSDTSAPSTPSSGFDPSSSDAGVEDAGKPDACVSQEAAAIPGTRPIDIIFAIDNSSSMSDEIGQVEEQINANFASVIAASNTDYHVIMLSKHGAHGGDAAVDPLERICVRAPLSGTTCNPIPPVPVDTARFIHHDIIINSQDAFCRILDSFNSADTDGNHPGGWSTFLRPSSFKVFAVITDDRVNTACNGLTFDDKFDDPVSGTTAAETFDSALLALSPMHFGSVAHRNYIWHSIIGVRGYDAANPQLPYPPDAPIVTDQCLPSSQAPATGYQALSKLTGGLRFPTCANDYTSMFQAMAKSVIDRAVVACDYAMPANPAGGTIDPKTAVVRYTSGANVRDFSQVDSAATCAPDSFYIDGDRIKLCPSSCDVVQSDPAAQVRILFGCLPKDGETTK